MYHAIHVGVLILSLIVLTVAIPSSNEDPSFISSTDVPLEKRDDVPPGYTSAPYYPAPLGGWASTWAASYAKAAIVVANMTLAEKVNLTTGVGYMMGPCVGNTGSALRFGIPRLCLHDGALGVARTDHVTAFPAGITTGSTFSKALMRARGSAIGAEAKGKGVNIQLGPSVGPLGRKPRGGRNWEGFGADPVLQAIGGRETVLGIQSQGVIATIKHWIGNEQEMYRMDIVPHGLAKALSSNIEDRVLHELYAWPFAEVVKAGVGAVMTSYNEVNGSSASQNSMLINGLLKGELGFQGFVMTDWLSHIGGVSAALAGQDMSMPGDGQLPLFGVSYWGPELSRSILNGTVPLSRLNDMVTRIVATWYQFGQDKSFPRPNFSAYTADAQAACYPGALFSPTCTVNEFVNVQSDHATIARQVAREGITMVKNVNATLPLSTAASLRVFGDDARVSTDGINACIDQSCNKGVLGMGWGGGTALYPYLDAPIDAIKRKAAKVDYYSSNNFPSNSTVVAGDIAIVFVNSDSGENSYTVQGNDGDRNYAGLYVWYGGDDLIKAAAAKYSTVIVVVHTVGPIVMENWINLPSVKAVLIAHLPGQEAGHSLTDILFGDYSPSGHLPYSITKAEFDWPASVSLRGFALGQVQDTFSEGLYIDYRYLQKNKIAPRFPFGHGLSYTTFSFTGATITAVTPLTSYPPTAPAVGSTPTYPNTIPPAAEVAYPSALSRVWRYLYPYLDNPGSITSSTPFVYPTGYSTTPRPQPPAGGGEGGNPALWDTVYTLSVTVSNTGKVAGKQVAMVFVQFPSTAAGEGWATPVLQLRAFEKTETLAPGEKAVVRLNVSRKDVSVWDVVRQNWVIPGVGKGEGFKFWIGQSSGDLGLACDGGTLRCAEATGPAV